MKIALIGPVYPYRGGIAQYTQQLRITLESFSHKTLLVSFARQYPAFLYPGKSDQDPSHQERMPDVRYLLDPLKPGTWLKASKEIDAFQPDRIVFQWWTTFWALPFYCIIRLRKFKAPTLFMVHNVLPHEKRFWDGFLARLALSSSDAFIVHTEREKHRLQSIIQTEHITICPLPLFKKFANENISRQDARERLHISPSQFVLLFFGIIRPYKGLGTLLKALSLLKERGQQPLLLVCGEFWEDIETYAQMVESLDITNQVRFDNRFIPDADANVYFSAADAMVAPYRGGTQSAAATNGLVYNLPVIASDMVADGIPTRFHGQVHSFPTGNEAALADVIETLITNRSMKKPASSTDLGTEWECLVRAVERSIDN